jgi:hypothetical protein
VCRGGYRAMKSLAEMELDWLINFLRFSTRLLISKMVSCGVKRLRSRNQLKKLPDHQEYRQFLLETACIINPSAVLDGWAKESEKHTIDLPVQYRDPPA